MKYKLIQGKFWVRGFSPDGDSIRFTVDNKENQKWFSWKEKENKDKAIKNKEIKMQLRLEAIDALETHYNNKYHQPRAFGIAGMDKLLRELGINIYKYSIDYTRITEADDGKHGYIITSGLDSYDRPISFVYTGTPSFKDGTEFEQYPKDTINTSINFKLLTNGIVYPTFYKGLDDKILKAYSKQTQAVRRTNTGIWAIERTKEFNFWETWTIQDDVVIFPKLFRRLASFIDYKSDYNELTKYFKETKDPVFIISEGQTTNFGKIIGINKRQISLKYDPEDLLFIPKD